MPVDRLAESDTPIVVLVGTADSVSAVAVWMVSLLTGLNGALVQIIMAARVAYGMAGKG